MNRAAFFCLVTIIFLFCIFLNSQVFASSNEAIKKELKKRIDSIKWAYEIKEYEKGHKESKELNSYIIKNRDKTIPILIEIVDDEKEKYGYRSEAIRRLGKLKIKEATDIIAKYVSDKGYKENIIVYSIEALAEIGDERSIRYLINYYDSFLKGLNRGYERAHAIRELSKLKDEEVINIFIKALSDLDSNIRLFAVKALGKWKVKKAIVPLKNLIKIEYSIEVKKAVQKSLEEIISDNSDNKEN